MDLAQEYDMAEKLIRELKCPAEDRQAPTRSLQVSEESKVSGNLAKIVVV